MIFLMLQWMSHLDLSNASSKLLLGPLVFMDNCVERIKQRSFSFILTDMLARLECK